MKKINYRKHSEEVLAAFFRWKKDTHGQSHSAVAFAAGYNAALAALADPMATELHLKVKR